MLHGMPEKSLMKNCLLQGVSLPAAQSVVNYAALAIVYGAILLHKKQPLKGRLYTYALLAALDVLANFCLVEAYAYTSLTSVTLLDCWTVPCELHFCHSQSHPPNPFNVHTGRE